MFRALLALSLLVLLAPAQSRKADYVATDRSSAAGAGPIRIPDRSSKPLFQGEQGQQRSEIHFDPATGMVTMKLLVQDPKQIVDASGRTIHAHVVVEDSYVPIKSEKEK